MKKITVAILLFIGISINLCAAHHAVDSREQVDLSDVDKITFEMGGPKCVLCLRTGTFEYSFSGGRRGSGLGISLEGDMTSNKRRALPRLIYRKNGRTLTVKLYEKNHLFFGLVQRGSVHFHAAIPAGFPGEVEIVTSSGDLAITDLSADVVRITSSSGDIEAAGIGGRLIEIKASSGKIEADALKAVQRLSIRASSGDIDLKESSADETHIEASSGRINIGRLHNFGELRIEASSGRITADEIESGSIRMESDSGRVAIGALSAESVGIKASSGSVDIAFPYLGGPVDIQSSSGDISISLPSGTGFSVDLKVSSGKIRSDFPLMGDVSDSREDSVRGVANNGGPLINLRASSGDIEIKKK